MDALDFSLHAPEVECIGKGNANRPYEFGVKVSVANTLSHAKGGQFATHVKALPSNPYDGHTLGTMQSMRVTLHIWPLTESELAMDEKRKAGRHRVLKAGKITFGGGVIDCTIRNMSETGAALDVESSVGIPDQFTLVVSGDRMKQRCRVAWRKEKRIGVLFGLRDPPKE